MSNLLDVLFAAMFAEPPTGLVLVAVVAFFLGLVGALALRRLRFSPWAIVLSALTVLALSTALIHASETKIYHRTDSVAHRIFLFERPVPTSHVISILWFCALAGLGFQ